MKEHKEFKPFDKVLIRLDANTDWQCDLYSHYDNEDNSHSTIGTVIYNEGDILPYEGNEELVGTTNEPDELDGEVKLEVGEFLFVVDRLVDNIELWAFVKHYQVLDKEFKTRDGLYWNYAIKFSDFNPYDFEESKKHILCVRNGKVIKYKG